jgi:hypothetical protein
MGIDTSGKWWIGSEAKDIEGYLTALKVEGYDVHATRICACTCGATSFKFQYDRDEGCAQRICAICGAKHLLCDSSEYWADATPEDWHCIECGCTTCNVGAAFSLYEPENSLGSDIRWISVGIRCADCGVLGSCVDWKVAYGPSFHLIEQA